MLLSQTQRIGVGLGRQHIEDLEMRTLQLMAGLVDFLMIIKNLQTCHHIAYESFPTYQLLFTLA